MTRTPPDPDPGARLRDEVREILVAEGRACLGVKVYPPIPVSEDEGAALARLRGSHGAGRESKLPGSSGSAGSSSGSAGSSSGSAGSSSGSGGSSSGSQETSGPQEPSE